MPTPTPAKFDSRFSPTPSSRKTHVWHLPPAPKTWTERLWDRVIDQLHRMFPAKPQLVVDPPGWFVRAQGDSRTEIALPPTPKSDVRRPPARPRPSLPSVNLPG